MDPDAPDLEEYLGDGGRIGLDPCAERGGGGGIEGVQKTQITCNWKLAVDNLFDWYHPQISHASALMSGYAPGQGLQRPKTEGAAPPPAASANPMTHRVLLGAYGHAISGPRITPE